MKKNIITLSLFSFVLFISVIFISCKKEKIINADQTLTEPKLPAEPFDYLNKHLVNSNVATLGRVLFYDKSMSNNDIISCGSCHKQEFAFADNVRFSKGFNGLDLKRNSPSIQGINGFFGVNNLSNTSSPTTPVTTNSSSPIINPSNDRSIPNSENQRSVLLFWDGRQKSMPDMVLNPVLNHNEMNLPDFPTLVDKLNKLRYYPALFESAFGDKTITKERIAYALEGFLSCLNTSTTGIQFSSYFTSSNPTISEQSNLPPTSIQNNLSPLEEQGMALFHEKYNCATCHDPSSPEQMFNIGLDLVYADNGLGNVSKKAGDNGLFKVPTLRNISLTAPYMHDGRFANLDEVLEHYSHGIKANANLSAKFLNADGTPKKLNIDPAEKQALIAFLNTLKDEDFLTSAMYSDPFKK